MPKAPDTTLAVVQQVRISSDLAARLDAYGDDLRSRQPGLRLSRADVVRMLLEEALAGKKRRT